MKMSVSDSCYDIFHHVSQLLRAQMISLTNKEFGHLLQYKRDVSMEHIVLSNVKNITIDQNLNHQCTNAENKTNSELQSLKPKQLP